MRKLIVLGVPIDDLTMEEALCRLEEFIINGRATGTTHQVATVNADFVVNALNDPELRRILQESAMATPDGMPLVWGARLLGVPIEGRVTGADLVPALAELSARKGYSLYFLGAQPGVAVRAAEILAERHPGLKVAGIYSPPPSSILEMDPSIVTQINAAQPDVLLVAFGNPKQEKWISMHRRDLHVPVCIGIGGTLDMIAGVTKRAPDWMQKYGFEWAYRLAQEPKRLWKRYVKDMFYFGSFFLRQWWEMRRRASPLQEESVELEPPAETTIVENMVVLQIKGRLDITNSATFVARATQAIDQNPHLIISLMETEFLDSTALGALVTLKNRARAVGGDVWLVAIPPHLAQLLKIVRLDQFFEALPDVEAVVKERQRRTEPLPEPEQEHGMWNVIKLPRIFDASNAPEVIERCAESLTRNPYLVLDFSETFFLASAGMAALMKLDRQARTLGGALRVAGCMRDVLRSIQLVRLDTIIALYDTVQAAVAGAPTTLPQSHPATSMALHARQ